MVRLHNFQYFTIDSFIGIDFESFIETTKKQLQERDKNVEVDSECKHFKDTKYCVNFSSQGLQ